MKYDCFAIGKNLDNISGSLFLPICMKVLNEISDVAKLLHLKISELDQLLISPNYACFSIPKKKGGTRIIKAPEAKLKDVQQLLNVYLQREFAHNFGLDSVFVSKKNGKRTIQSPLVQNAISHVKKKYILSLDIKDFYESITSKQVFELFVSQEFNFPEKIALILTRLTTYQGYIPTGASTSPILSNFIFAENDNVIKETCATKGITFTRYADDLTFSSDNPFSNEFIQEIESILSPFTLNSKKTRIVSKNRQQKVTGIVVNEKVNIDRKWLKKLRAMLHDIEKNGLKKASFHHFKKENKEQFFLNRVEGYLSFLGQVKGVKDVHYLKYKTIFKDLKSING